MSKILEKLADQHEERIINVLYKLEEDVVKEVTRATKGQLVSQRLAIQLRPAIKKLIDESFLDEADTIINQEYNKIAKEVLDRFGEMPIPSKFKSLTEVDLRTINALKYQSFSGFEDIAERFLKVINDEVYQSTIAGRPFEDMVSNIRSHINGVYKSSNSAEINELVDFINENKFDNSKKAQVEEAVRKLHTQYASDRAGNNLRRYASQIAHDSVMQFHGQFTVAKAKEAGLTHYTYTGTLVRDSREFCRGMLNRTLTEEQIREMWNTRAWQGKSTGDPFIVRGGYRCRHTWLPTDPAWGEETVDDLPTEEEVPPPPPPRTTVSDVSIGFLLNAGLRSKPSAKKVKAYDEDFNSQLTNQQKRIVEQLPKPKTIRDSKKGYYVPSTGQLNAELNAQDGRLTPVKSFVIAHEYGHHVDYITGKDRKFWSETNINFRNAIAKDKQKFKGKMVGKSFARDEAEQVIKDYKIDESEMKKMFNKLGFYETREITDRNNPSVVIVTDKATSLKGDGYGEVSDIFDALTRGTFRRDYKMWGHTTSYWRDRGAVETEIFANLFAIRHNKKAYDLAKSFMPNTVKEFEKRLDFIEKNTRG